MRGNTDLNRGNRPARSEFESLSEGDVLCDRHRRECYQVTVIDDDGIGLHRDGVEFYAPRSLFVTWYGRRLFSVENTRSIEVPAWCEQRQGGEDPLADRPDQSSVAVAARTDH